MDNTKYTHLYEWVKKEAGLVRIGITKKAVVEIGEIVHVELPQKGALLQKGQEAVVLESTKAAIDSYAPLTGKVIDINEKLLLKTYLLNSDPEGEGWLYCIEHVIDN